MRKQKLDAFTLTLIAALGLANQPLQASETDGLSPIGTMGKSRPILKQGEQVVLNEHEGKGALTHFDKEKNRFAAYRFHDHDPIFFQNGLRLTCRNGETRDGSLDGPPHSTPPRARYTTYTWVYQW